MKTNLAMAAVTAAMLAGSPAAKAATISFGLQEAGVNGGAKHTVQSANADAGVDVNPMTYGIFNFVLGNGSESLGTYLSQSVVKITSLSKSGPGNIYNPKLGGTITVWVTEQGITGGGTTLFTQGGLTSNTLSAGWSVNESLWIDPNNGLYTQIDHVLPSTNGTFTGFDHADARTLDDLSLYLNHPYSITEVYTITAPAYGTAHLTLVRRI